MAAYIEADGRNSHHTEGEEDAFEKVPIIIPGFKRLER